MNSKLQIDGAEIVYAPVKELTWSGEEDAVVVTRNEKIAVLQVNKDDGWSKWLVEEGFDARFLEQVCQKFSEQEPTYASWVVCQFIKAKRIGEGFDELVPTTWPVTPTVEVLIKEHYHCSTEQVIIIGGQWVLSTDDDCDGIFFEEPRNFVGIPNQPEVKAWVVGLLDKRPDTQVYFRSKDGWTRKMLPENVREQLEEFATQP